MTKDHDLKAVVRQRMAHTGESYAAARRQLAGDEDGAPELVATFPKSPERHRWVATLEWSDGRRAEMPILLKGTLTMPHDLEHYVVEAGLDLSVGFWPLLSAYGPWQSVRPLDRPWGRELISTFRAEVAAHRYELEDVESLTVPTRVLASHDWPGWDEAREVLARHRRGARPNLLSALSEPPISALVAAYQEIQSRWAGLTDGDSLRVSWPPPPAAELRAELHGYLFRRVADLTELAALFDSIGSQFDPPFSHRDTRYEQPARRLGEDCSMMVMVRHRGRLVGGVVAFRTAGAVTVRAVGLEAEHRRKGVGTRLVQIVEMEAASLGAPSINLGGVNDGTRPFYQHLGYRGRHSMMQKDLPLGGPSRDLRLRRSREKAGALEIGMVVPSDTRRGRVSPLI